VLAFDYGSTRIGVAVSDALRLTAGPREVIPAADASSHVRRLVDELQPTVIVVGLPVGLSGAEGPAALAARRFGDSISTETGLPVVFVDERFTTKTAEAAMLEGGAKRRNRRQNVDKVAAAVILQQFLERSRLADGFDASGEQNPQESEPWKRAETTDDTDDRI
jgi:putative Holliday junction resolvase